MPVHTPKIGVFGEYDFIASTMTYDLVFQSSVSYGRIPLGLSCKKVWLKSQEWKHGRTVGRSRPITLPYPLTWSLVTSLIRPTTTNTAQPGHSSLFNERKTDVKSNQDIYTVISTQITTNDSASVYALSLIHI